MLDASRLDYLREITRERVRQVLAAGGKGQTVLDGGRYGHSVFTGRFLQALEEVDGYITAKEIGYSVPEKVFYDAQDRGHKQQPQFGRLSGQGDFVFVRKDALVEVLPTTPASGTVPGLPPETEQPGLQPFPSISPYSFELSFGGIWPEGKDLERVFSKDADSRIISEPAPAIEVTVKRKLENVELRNVRASFFLAWPKSLPTPSSFAGHEGFLGGVLLSAERPLPFRFFSHKTYLSGGAGLWFFKFSRIRMGEALDLNPAFRLGIGSDIRTYKAGDLSIEGAYLPLKGPTYVINSFNIILRYTLRYTYAGRR